MKNVQDYIDLKNAISWKNKTLVDSVLSSTKSLDMLYRDGSIFIRPIEDNSIEIVKALLEYFEENQLSQYEKASEEYYELHGKLVEALEIAIDDVHLSKGMKEVLSSHLDFTNSNHDSLDSRANDFDEMEFDISINSKAEDTTELTVAGDISPEMSSSTHQN